MENKHMLVETHIGLVSRMAKQLMKKNSNCDWLTEDDLLGAGCEGAWPLLCRVAVTVAEVPGSRLKLSLEKVRESTGA